MGAFAEWADRLASYDSQDPYGILNEPLPMVGLSGYAEPPEAGEEPQDRAVTLGGTLKPGEVLETHLHQPVTDFFADTPSPTTDDLLALLDGLDAAAPGFTFDVRDVAGGRYTTPDGDGELRFDLVLELDRTRALQLDLGAATGLDVPADGETVLDLEAGLALPFAFGFDLSEDLDPADAFFIRPGELTVEADLHRAGDLAFPVTIASLGADVTGGTFDLDVDIAFTFRNPDADAAGNITQVELAGMDVSELMDPAVVTPATLAADLPIQPADGLFSPDDLRITIDAEPLADTPADWALAGSEADLEAVRAFDRLHPSHVLDAVTSLEAYLDALDASEVTAGTLPLAESLTLADVADFGDAFRERVADPLRTVNDAEQVVPAFGDTARLLDLLGDHVTEAAYDPASHELTFHVQWADEPVDPQTGTLSLEGMDLGPLTGLDNVSGTVTFTGTSGMGFRLGFDLSPFEAQAAAPGPLPADGRLDADAHFRLVVDGWFPKDDATGDPLWVTVAAADTADNADADDLAGDVAEAVAAAFVAGGIADVAVTEEGAGADRRYTVSGTDAPAVLVEAVGGHLVFASRSEKMGADVRVMTDPVLRAPDPLPAGGALTADATFDLTLGDTGPTTVIVPADWAADNVSPADLAADVRQAAMEAGIEDLKVSVDGGNRLTFEPTDPTAWARIHITAGPADPATTELGLGEGLVNDAAVTQLGLAEVLAAGDTIASRTWVQEVGLSAAIVASADAPTGAGRLGPVEMGVTGGTIGAEATLGLSALPLRTDADTPGDPAGPISLARLSTLAAEPAAYTEVTLAAVTPTPAGAADLAVTVNDWPFGPSTLAGTLQLGLAAGALDASPWYALAPAGEVTGNLPSVLAFQRMTADDLTAALTDLVAALHEYQQARPADATGHLPVAGLSFAELAPLLPALDDGLAGALESSCGDTTIQGAADALTEALQSLDLTVDAVEMTVDGSDLAVDIQATRTFDPREVPLSIDLDWLADQGAALPPALESVPPDPCRVPNIRAVEENLTVAADGQVYLDLGFTLDPAADPVPWFGEETTVVLSAAVREPTLTAFEAMAGALEIDIADGAAVVLDADGDPATTDDDPAKVTIAPAGPGAYGTAEDLGAALSAERSGTAKAILTVVDDANPPEDPDPVVDIRVNLADPALAEPTSQINLADMLAGAEVLEAALDGLPGPLADALHLLEQAVDKPLGVKIPIIGDEVDNPLPEMINIFAGDGGLAEAIVAPLEALPRRDAGTIRHALFDELGPAGEEWLKDADENGTIELADVTVDQGADHVGFTVPLAWTQELVSEPLGVDLALPGLGLEISDRTRFDITLSSDLALVFGVSREAGFYLDTSASEDDGGRAELEATLDVGFHDVIDFTARLGFLEFNVSAAEDEHGDPLTNALHGVLNLDLLDPNKSGKLTAYEIETILALEEGERPLGGLLKAEFKEREVPHAAPVSWARLNLVLEAGFDENFPSLATDFVLDWDIGGLVAGKVSAGKSIEVRFENIRLNLGEFFSEFVSPIVDNINTYVVEPLSPIVDVLTYRLPVISDLAGGEVTLLDLGRWFAESDLGGSIEGLETAVKVIDFLDAFGDVFNVVQQFDALNDETYITLIDEFKIAGPESEPLRDGFTNEAQEDAWWDAVGEDIQAHYDSLGDLSAALSDNMTDDSPEIEGFYSRFKSHECSIHFPLLEPWLEEGWKEGVWAAVQTAPRFLFGEDVDLFTMTLPSFEFEAGTRQRFGPIWYFPPVFLTFSGSVGASAEFAFGYDTWGLRQFKDGGWNDPAVLVNGLYADAKKSKLGFTGKVAAGVSAGIPGIAEVGADGGVKASVALGLKDDSPDPSSKKDGRAHLDEMAANAAESPLCLFQLEGSLDAFLRVWWEALWVFGDEYELAGVTLLDFTAGCDVEPPELAHVSDGTLTLHMGPHAVLRQGDCTEDRDETFHVRQAVDSETGLPLEGTYEVRWKQYTQLYGTHAPPDDWPEGQPYDQGPDINRIEADGGFMDDEIVIGADVHIPAELDGGPGDDLLVGGSGNDTLVGGLDADTLRGGEGVDYLYGHEGDSLDDAANPVWWDLPDPFEDLYVYDGDDELRGGPGDDELHGHDGDDELYGGKGTDHLLGGIDDDVLKGGDGIDYLYGNPGKDNLLGGSQDDILQGGPGTDFLLGQAHDDHLYGCTIADAGTERDFLFGDHGYDYVYRGSPHAPEPMEEGDDWLYGGGGDDHLEAEGTAPEGENHLFGQAGDDDLRGGPGTDRIEGGVGSDAIDGDAGDDTLYGEDDAGSASPDPADDGDYIAAGSGNDTVYGGPGDDRIWGEDGIDTIHGGLGADHIAGLTGNDILYGEDDLGSASADPNDDGDTIHGGSGEDEIHGNAGPDYLYGGTDRDTIRGDDGGDILNGGPGDDDLHGGADGDMLYGKAGNDFIEGDAGGDTVHGGPGHDEIHGHCAGGAADDDDATDYLYGRAGDDLIHGNGGADIIYGDDVPGEESGQDDLYGDAGGDFIYGGLERDRIWGGDGVDEIRGQADPDALRGGPGDDVILGGDADDVLHGEEGSDDLYGEAGRDRLHGGLGDDELYCGDGEDTAFGDEGGDTLDGGPGDDTLDGGPGADTVSGGWGDDLLIGGGGVGDVLHGDWGDDRIVGSDDGGPVDPDFTDDTWFGDRIEGGPGRDIIFALGGADYILGGPDYLLAPDGDDRIDAGVGSDYVDGQAGNDWLFAGHGYGDEIHGGIGDDEIWGSHDGSDRLLGEDGRDALYGQGGDDELLGAAGDDTLDGGTGTDTISGGDGNDVLFGGGGDGDTLLGEAGDDVLHGSDDGGDEVHAGPGSDTVFAGGGNDTAHGGPGDDVLRGGPGDDTLAGGEGRDLLLGEADHDVLYGHAADGAGDDNAPDELYGDFGTGNDEPASGRDHLFGQGGNDSLFGEGDDDLLEAGPGGGDLVDPGAGDDPDAWTPPAPTADPAPAPSEAQVIAEPTLPEGTDGVGWWLGLGGSAGPAGLSRSDALALEPSATVDALGRRYVAWVDGRHGNYEVYVARHTDGVGWEALAGSAEAGGVSDTPGSSRRPVIVLGADGQPVVAWTEFHDDASDIYAARYDPAAGGGQGGWVALGGSLASAGLSQTGQADRASLAMTDDGPVVAWLDTSGAAANVLLRRFDGDAWVELDGSATGGGVSESAQDVADPALAAAGTDLAVAWTQPTPAGTQVYLRRWEAGAWVEVEGSASGGGLSESWGRSHRPAPAWHGGDLFVAFLESGTGYTPAGTGVRVRRYDAGTGSWGEADPRPSAAAATSPQLVSGGGVLHLTWLDDRADARTGTGAGLYTATWDGIGFAGLLPGEDRGGGVDVGSVSPASPALAVDPDGNPVLAWAAFGEAAGQVRLRANTLPLDPLATIYADGSAGHTVADVLAAHDLGPGDAIVVTGDHGTGFTVGGDDAGVRIIGLRGTAQALIDGDVTVRADDVLLQRLDLGGSVTLDGPAGGIVAECRVAGGLIVEGGSEARILENVLAGGLQLTAASGAAAEDNDVSGGVELDAVTGVRLTSNRIAGDTALAVLAPSGGVVSDNDLQAPGGTGLAIEAAFTGTIARNRIHDAAVGVAYHAPAALSANTVYACGTGVEATVDSAADGFGFVSPDRPNEIYSNDVGVDLTGRMQNQSVYDNTVGVAGTGLLGPAYSDFEHANVIADNATGVTFEGTVQFNRIAGNDTGLVAVEGQLVGHNLVYRNSEVGVHVSGVDDVRIVNNTFYGTAGDLVRVDDGAARTEVRNNILWAEGGDFAVYVANDSQTGYFGDFNDLHATGRAVLYYWTRDFTDVLDLQADVAEIELHSIGTTVPNPAWSVPRLQNRGDGDFRMLPLTAGRRRSSPSLDAADPLTDLHLPASHVNLLANPGFESGLADWEVNPEAGAAPGTPPPFEGDAAFDPGSASEGFAQQTMDLTAAGWSDADLDSQDLVIVFGGRVRAGDEALPDTGRITLEFLDAGGDPLGEAVAEAANVADRWELLGKRVGVPAGTRSVRLSFRANRRSGSHNDSYLDGAFVSVLPETVAGDQGAYGFTDADVDLAEAHLALRRPDLYTDIIQNRPQTVRWSSYGNADDSAVRVDLYQDDPVHGPALFATLATATGDDGEFTWIPENVGVDGDTETHGYRVRVSLVDRPLVWDCSIEPSTAMPEIGNPGYEGAYYVDDGDDAGDEYTPAATGSNRHSGRRPDAPKPNPVNVLRTYDLTGGETLFVDTGDYPMIHPFSAHGSVDVGPGLDEGFLLTGPVAPAHTARLSPAIPGDASFALVELYDADFVTVRHLTLENAGRGLWVHSDSEAFAAEHVTADGHAGTGIDIATANPAWTAGYLAAAGNGDNGIVIEGTSAGLEHCTAEGNGGDGIRLTGSTGGVENCAASGNAGDGIRINGPITGFADNVASGNGATGFRLSDSGTVTVTGNEANGNTSGLYVAEADTGQAVTVSGNRVYGNTSWGISASGHAFVTGNTVSGLSGGGDVGIRLAGAAEATGNVVFNAEHGIDVQEHASGAVAANRIYACAGNGITVRGTTDLERNVVYDCGVGVYAEAFSWASVTSRIVNNLLYAIDDQAILIRGGGAGSTGDLDVVNNTVYQPVGNGVRVAFPGSDVDLRNNILHVEDGYGIYVAADSAAGFASDYNLFDVAGGVAGSWQGVDRPTLADWQLATFGDAGSLAQPPRFVDPDGPDDVLGCLDDTADGRDDDFHLRSPHGSYHGGALAPVLDAGSGLPVFLTPVETADAESSPGIDRGDPTDGVADEPTPNGGYVNLGAYGGTDQASKSPAQYVLVLDPNGSETIPLESTCSVRWRSHGLSGNVRIAYSPTGAGGSFSELASDTADDGVFDWYLDPALFSTTGDGVIRITSIDDPGIDDLSDAPFTVAEAVHVYYVNDGTVEADDWTTAPGDDANDGLTPATPKATLQALLAAYSLGASDTVRVDAGQYVLPANVIVGADDAGVTIEGYADAAWPDRRAVLDRAETSSGSYGFELDDADDVTLRDLALTGARRGVYASGDSDSDDLVIEGCEVYAQSNTGIYLDASNDGAILAGNTIHDNGKHGVVVNGEDAVISANVVYGHSGSDAVGIKAKGARAEVRENDVYGSDWNGIYLNASAASATDNRCWDNHRGIRAVGSSGWDTILVADNRCYDNRRVGISVVTNVEVVGNTVYGHTGDDDRGIYLKSATVSDNEVYDNFWGVYVSDSGTVRGNTVYDNSRAGVYVWESGRVENNVIYGCHTGIKLDQHYATQQVTGNLVYDADLRAVEVRGYYNRAYQYGSTTEVAGNTIYQPDGDGVVLEHGAGHVHLRNNILDVQSGAALDVSLHSQVDFTSDYNLFHLGRGARLASWDTLEFADRADWFYALGFDAHSLEADPQFVDPDGADDVLGYDAVNAVDYGEDDDFHLRPGSPAVDRGDPADAIGDEPARHGGRINLGAYGGTAGATPSPAEVLQVLGPHGLEKFEVGQDVAIRWHSHGVPGTRVRIDLVDAGGAVAANLVADADLPGEWTWTVPAGVTPGPYRIRVTALEGGGAVAESGQFLVVPEGPDYYVNVAGDGDLSDNEYTTAAGDNANSGKAPDAPMAGLGELLRLYDLEAGDTVWVDTGAYDQAWAAGLDASESGVTIRGPTGPAHAAVLHRPFSYAHRNVSYGGYYVIELQDAADVTLENLTATGGYHGICGSEAHRLTVRDCEITGSHARGVNLDGCDDVAITDNHIHDSVASEARGISLGGSGGLVSGNEIHGHMDYGIHVAAAGAVVSGNQVYDNGRDISNPYGAGINVNAADVTVTGNEVYDNIKYGISTHSDSGVTITNNEVYDNRSRGIYAQTNGSQAQSLVAGNIVYGNTYAGIDARDNVLVTGNVVYGHTGDDDRGIYMSGAEVTGNVVHGNYWGMTARYGVVRENRAYNNSHAGIYGYHSTKFERNVVYANPTGLYVYQNWGPTRVEGNLVYDCPQEAVLIVGESDDQATTEVIGNTLRQDGGAAIRLRSGAYNVSLRNNIFSVPDGSAIEVPADSQVGFTSDYNLFHLEGTAHLGTWGDLAYATRTEWFYDVGFDAHSFAADPLFVDPDGADDLLGYDAVGGGDGGGDDDFHLQPTSPAIDRGNPADDVADEPAPNGGRINLGAYGGTDQAATSPAEVLQVLGPHGLEKFEAGQDVAVRWHSHGVPGVGPDEAHAGAVMALAPDAYYRLNETAGTTAVDAAGSFHGTYLDGPTLGAEGAFGPRFDTAVTFASSTDRVDLPHGLLDGAGDVTMSLWFRTTRNGHVVSGAGSGNTNEYLVFIGGTEVRLYTGGSVSAYVNWSTSSLTDGEWHHLALVRDQTNQQAELFIDGASRSVEAATLEPLQIDAGGLILAEDQDSVGGGFVAVDAFVGDLDEVAFFRRALSPEDISAMVGPAYGITVDVDLVEADTGTVVAPIADDLLSPGTLDWTIPPGTPDGAYRVRVRAVDVPGLEAVSPDPFAIVNDGTAYYVNLAGDADLSDNEYTTAAGDNARGGKRADAPMASVAVLLDHYDLDPGDVVHVDTGTYVLHRDVLIEAQDAGVTLRGPVEGVHDAVLDRDTTAEGRYVVDLQEAPDVTLEHLGLVGGYHGIRGSGADRLAVRNCEVTGSSRRGITLGDSDDVTITDNRIHDTLDGGDGRGIHLGGEGGEITGNEVYGHGDIGIYVAAAGAVVSDNVVYDNGHIYAGSLYGSGIHAGAAGVTVVGNEVYNNIKYGIYTSGHAGVVIQGNEVYGNNSRGVYAAVDADAGHVLVSENVVHGNAWVGIDARSNVLVTGNVVYDHAGEDNHGIYTHHAGIWRGSVTATGNIVHGNYRGITAHYGEVCDNRVYDSSHIGIYGYHSTTIERNVVYSSPIGLDVHQHYGPTRVANNLVYDCSEQALLIRDAATGYSSEPRTEVEGNTLWQEVGETVRLQDGAMNVRLRNNVLSVGSGYVLYVPADSQAGFDSDSNLLDLGAGGALYWDGGLTFAEWQALGHDPASRQGDPLFVDIDGADNVLGYETAGEGTDGGADDNFYPSAGSPAIDWAETWRTPRVDHRGLARHDDPGTPNLGTPDYAMTDLGTSLFAEVGTALGWHSVNGIWTRSLPFAFPFYGVDYTSVQVSADGFLRFAGSGKKYDESNSTAELQEAIRIAPLWDDLSTYCSHPGDPACHDIYIDESVPGQITIRWNATAEADGGEVNVAVTLFDDARIRFDYGPGNANLTPTVGISRGDGEHYRLAPYDGQADLAEVNSIEFALTTDLACVDVGACEFQGESGDLTPPTVTAVSPLPPDGGVTNADVAGLVITFSEPMGVVSAGSGANYELVGQGPDGSWGTADDLVVGPVPVYEAGETSAQLTWAGGPLPDDAYRLTLRGAATSFLADASGNRLDGEGDGSAGGDYVRAFTIDQAPPAVTAVSINEGRLQRSYLDGISVSCSEAVLAAAEVLTLRNETTTEEVDISGAALSGSGTDTLRWDFTGTALDNGYHAAILLPSAVEDAAGNPMTAEYEFTFHILKGDATGDAKTNIFDLLKIRQNYLLPADDPDRDDNADVTGDGNVNIFDLLMVRQNYLRELQAPVGGTSPGAAAASEAWQQAAPKLTKAAAIADGAEVSILQHAADGQDQATSVIIDSPLGEDLVAGDRLNTMSARTPVPDKTVTVSPETIPPSPLPLPVSEHQSATSETVHGEGVLVDVLVVPALAVPLDY